MDVAKQLASSFQRNVSLSETLKDLDDDSFSSDESAVGDFERKVAQLKFIAARDFQLKVAIESEKLKKRLPLTKNKERCHEEISNLQIEIQNLKEKIKEDMLNREKDYVEILVDMADCDLPTNISEKQKMTLNSLMNSRLHLNKQIKDEQKDIAALKENINKLNNDKKGLRTPKKRKLGDIKMEKKQQELEKISSTNKKEFERFQMLTKILQSMTDHHIFTKPLSEMNYLLKPLQPVYRNILKASFDDPQTLNGLLIEISQLQI